MSVLHALLFDVDGTLAETERDGHREAFNQAFAEDGLPWHWGERRYGELLQVSGGRERIRHFAAAEDPEWLRRAGADELIGRIHRHKNHHYQELLRGGGVTLRRGLRGLLQQALAADLQLAVVTTTSRDNLDALLRATLDADCRAAFRVRITGEDVARKKPDAECYRLALAALGLRPEQALAVEDSRNGLLAARGAGVQTLIVRSFYFEHEDFGGALAVVDDFEALRLPDLLHRFECGASVSLPTQSAPLPDPALVQ